LTCRLGVEAGRHRLRIGDRDAAVAGKLGDIEALLDLDVGEFGVLRCDQHQLVTQQVDARIGPNERLAGEVVHPFDVGGNEDVSRRAGFDLLGKRRTRRVACSHLRTARLGEGGIDVVEGVFQRGGGENGDPLLRGRVRRRARQGGEEGKTGKMP